MEPGSPGLVARQRATGAQWSGVGHPDTESTRREWKGTGTEGSNKFCDEFAGRPIESLCAQRRRFIHV